MPSLYSSLSLRMVWYGIVPEIGSEDSEVEGVVYAASVYRVLHQAVHSLPVNRRARAVAITIAMAAAVACMM